MEGPNYKKYGVPIYSVASAPSKSIRFVKNQSHSEGDDHDSDNSPALDYFALAGGGGEGRSGIPNAILLARFDAASNSLSDQPVAKLGTSSELPYRMSVHPAGDGLICAMPNACRWFEWDENKSEEEHKLGLKTSEKVLSRLEDVGQQLALAFSKDGSSLAVGGEDGNLRVFKWPSMEIILHETDAHTTVKDLDFSYDGKFLVSLGSGGPCRVWDLTSSKVITSLHKGNNEVFSSCRFSFSGETQVLYVAALTGKGGSIQTWDTNMWKKIHSKFVAHDSLSALNVSADGKFLACGTTQGDLVIVNSSNMKILTTIRKAHLGIVTALTFSNDSRAVASVSLDSSVRVTLIEDKSNNGGLNIWIMVIVILLAIAAYFLKLEGISK